jgi:hypothetical protein
MTKVDYNAFDDDKNDGFKKSKKRIKRIKKRKSGYDKKSSDHRKNKPKR